ncbi:MAG TPA: sulfotransferase, partial [Candidatus Caenarcaniphilales bacterium]|nr:sulfotransferase [Candidatus Caenarcaniphilales bacterium]
MAAEPSPAEPEAIFIVGVSRSGTTLLRRVMETSERVAIAMENHFLGHLVEREGARHYFRRLGQLQDDATVRRIVELIYSGEFQRQSRFRELSPYWRWLIENIGREDFERRLLAGERTERGVMRELMRTYADFRGRPV